MQRWCCTPDRLETSRPRYRVRDETDHLLFDEVLASTGLDALPEPQEGFDLNHDISTVCQRLIKRAMNKTGNNQTKAAKLLGISQQALSMKLKRQDESVG